MSEIEYDVTGAVSAVNEADKAQFKAAADPIVAAIVAVGKLGNVPIELKVSALQRVLPFFQQLMTAFYAGNDVPEFGAASGKPRMVHELPINKVDPSDAPTRALFQVIADTLYGGDLEHCARSLNALFQPLADSTMTPGQRNGRGVASERVIAGAPGYEVRDDGSLQATQELADVRAQLARATRELTAATRDRDAARGQVRDITGQLDDANTKRQAAERERQLAKDAMTTAESDARTARDAASRAKAQLDRVVTYQSVIDALNAVDDADRPSRINDATAAAQGIIAEYREVLDALDAAAPEDRPALIFDAVNAAKGDVRKYREALRDIASVLTRGGFNNNRVLGLLREGTRRVMRAVSEPPARS